MIKEKLPKLIEKRDSIDGNIFFTTDPTIQEMFYLLSKDINATIEFLDNDCTGYEFVSMSEIFDEIAEATQSHAFIDALKRCAIKYPKETREYNILYFIDSAADYIK